MPSIQAASGFSAAVFCVLFGNQLLAARPVQPEQRPALSQPASSSTQTTPALPPEYAIGVDDILSIRFWGDQQMSSEGVVVRPDGRISLPILNDVQAAGLSPEQLRQAIMKEATKYKDDPIVQVEVKQANSRRVFLLGEVVKPGPYAMTGRLTVMQLLAVAGGLTSWANSSEITVIRTENGEPRYFRVNYKDLLRGRNLRQNIELAVGDTVMVP